MSDGKFTQADLDSAIEKAVGSLKESIGKLEQKNEELVGDVRKAKAEARANSEIKPEHLQAAEDRADKAEAALAEAQKQVKVLTGERDKAVKALETESGAARTYALEAEINGAIAAGNVVPALAPHFKNTLLTQAQAELVDGKYVVKIGDKSAADHIKSYLESDEGKVLRAATPNGGGGAPGSGGQGSGSANPFAKETMNLTEQGKLLRADPAQAKVLAAAAGVELQVD